MSWSGRSPGLPGWTSGKSVEYQKEKVTLWHLTCATSLEQPLVTIIESNTMTQWTQTKLMNRFCGSPFADWLERNDMACFLRSPDDSEQHEKSSCFTQTTTSPTSPTSPTSGRLVDQYSTQSLSSLNLSSSLGSHTKSITNLYPIN